MLPGRVSASEVCAWLDISNVVFARLCNEGVLKRESRKDGYDLRQTVRTYCDHMRRQASGRGSPDEQQVLSSARARAAVATAEQMELRTQIARGKYVPLDALRVALDDMIITYRQELLWTIPSAAAAVVFKHAPEVNSNEV